MKRSVAFTVCVYMMGGGLALAQIKPGLTTTPKPTPFSNIQTGTTNRTSSSGIVKNPNMHGVNVVIRQQMKQIQNDRQSGKLTEAQAKAAWQNLMNIRKQENDYFKQNGQREITSDQKTQLTTLLNQNTSGI